MHFSYLTENQAISNALILPDNFRIRLEGNFSLTRPSRNIMLNHEMDTGGVSIPSKVTTAIINTMKAISTNKLVLSTINECL